MLAPMDWTSLGHAGWLIEAGELRLLCDPLIDVEHHGGVFEVTPRRRLRAEGLRPDFLLISHRHPDHFDIPSLARLAELDPETVVVTPDELVVSSARALGFQMIELLPPGQRVELDGATLVTTESLAPDEWGVMVGTEDGVVWNMVDSVLRDADHARAVTRQALEALGHARVDLALVHGQPMLEVAAQLGQALRFPHARYAEVLRLLAAIEAGAILPSAAGTVHAPAYAWLNTIVYPVDEARFRRDIAKLCPKARVLSSQLGACFRVRRGEVEVEAEPEASAALIERLDGGPSCAFRPVSVPALEDPGATDEHARERITAWITNDLREALARNYSSFGVDEALRFVIEVVYTDGRAAWTLIVDEAGARVEAGFDPQWDVLDVLAGSLFADVLAGRRHWGELLLAGALRGYIRAYALGPRGLTRANVGEMFVYYALSYDESTERAVAWELERLARHR